MRNQEIKIKIDLVLSTLWTAFLDEQNSTGAIKMMSLKVAARFFSHLYSPMSVSRLRYKHNIKFLNDSAFTGEKWWQGENVSHHNCWQIDQYCKCHTITLMVQILLRISRISVSCQYKLRSEQWQLAQRQARNWNYVGDSSASTYLSLSMFYWNLFLFGHATEIQSFVHEFRAIEKF